MNKLKLSLLAPLLLLTGCITTCPPDAFKVNESSLEKRQSQSRRYESSKEGEILLASAGALQDMGYTIDESAKPLGLVVASKDRDATNGGQVALVTFAALLGGTADYGAIDKTQKIRASVVTKLSEDGKNTVVRVTFQRIVWNARGAVSRVETLGDPVLYQGFFEKISKAIFLEGQKI